MDSEEEKDFDHSATPAFFYTDTSVNNMKEIDEANIKEEVPEIIIKVEVPDEILNIKEELIEEEETHITQEVEEEDPLEYANQNKRKRKKLMQHTPSISFDKYIAEKRKIYESPNVRMLPKAYHCPICLSALKLDQPPFGKFLYDHFKQHASLIGTLFDLMDEKRAFWCKLCLCEIGAKKFNMHFKCHLNTEEINFENIYLDKSGYLRVGIKRMPTLCMFCQEQVITACTSSEEGERTLFEHLKNNHKASFSCIFDIKSDSNAFFCKYCQSDVSTEFFKSHLMMHQVGTNKKNNPDVVMAEVSIKIEGSHGEYRKEKIVKEFQQGPTKPLPNLNVNPHFFGSCAVCSQTFQTTNDDMKYNIKYPDSVKNSKIFRHYSVHKAHRTTLMNVIQMNDAKESFFCLLCNVETPPLQLRDHIEEHLEVKNDIYFNKIGNKRILEIRVEEGDNTPGSNIALGQVNVKMEMDYEEQNAPKHKTKSKKYTCRGCNKNFISLSGHFKGKIGQNCKQQYSEDEQDLLTFCPRPSSNVDIKAENIDIKTEMLDHHVDTKMVDQNESVDNTSEMQNEENDAFHEGFFEKKVICLGCNHEFASLFRHFRGGIGKNCKQKYSEEELKIMYDAKIVSKLEYQRKYQKQFQKQYNSHYHKDHKDKIDAYRKQYREQNKEKLQAYQKQYRKENKDKLSDYQKHYHQENRERLSDYQKIYHKENREKLSDYQKRYQKENKGEISDYRRVSNGEGSEDQNEYNEGTEDNTEDNTNWVEGSISWTDPEESEGEMET